jgi:hypothetical protein
MSECKFEDLIDEYLLNTISEEKRDEFEEHYFNCPACFQKMSERDDMIAAIKWKGEEIFSDLLNENQLRGATWWDRLTGLLTPRQWALAAVSAALVLVVTFGVLPSLKTQAPQFFLDDHQTRGLSITLISDSIPSRFEWQKMENAWEYKIEIDSHTPLWRKTTTNNFAILPDEIKNRMKAGVSYSWQVKAYSREGILIAESSKIQFSLPEK